MKGFNREIRSGVTVRVYKFYVFHDILYMYVFEIYTHMFKHVQRSQFTPHFDQGGLDTEVDLLLQQLEDRLCVLVRGHIKPWDEQASPNWLWRFQGCYIISLILGRYGRWSNLRSLGFNWVENTDSITLLLTNLARWLASNVKTGPLKFAYVLRLLLHRVFRKELRKTIGIQSVEHVLESYPHFFPIAIVVEDLDSRSLALQKMDRKDHSRPFCGWHKTSNTNKELRLVKYSNNFPRVIQNHCFFS